MYGWHECTHYATKDNIECKAQAYKDDRVGLDDADLCKPCVDGMDCSESGNTLSGDRLKKKYWRTSEKSSKLEECFLPKACRSTGPLNSLPDSSDKTKVNESSRETFTFTDEGWCFSDLDLPPPSVTTNSADECWSACREQYGTRIVAIDWYAEGGCCIRMTVRMTL